jgi:hypothetical protein
MSNIIIEDWLIKEATPGQFGADPYAGGPGAGAGQPGMPGAGAGGPPPGDPNVSGPAPTQMNPPAKEQGGDKPGKQPDVTNDPQAPDMPADRDSPDFEQWKNLYFKESIKGDTQKLIDLINQVRDLDLDSYPRKFVEDNLQVQFLRQHANIDKASKEIRKLLREELDQNNPSVSVVNHISDTLQQMPELNNIFIKLGGTLGMKGDLHRKFIAALVGGVQVGSGGNNEDVIYNEKEYSIRISTRFNAKFGKLDIGKWAMREDDPERYLSEPELRRLEEGSPEEKDVLRRRVVMESIAETFKTRAFIANVVGSDGTIYTLGWDLSNSLRSAYTDGKLVVRTVESDRAEAMIDDNGAIIPFVEIKILYAKETGNTDENGKPETEEHPFMVREDGMLFLTADLNIMREAASSFSGIVMKELPYPGNPSDLKILSRCVPSAPEIIMRNC